jgi:NADH-quinone oxidoreductase subunit K
MNGKKVVLIGISMILSILLSIFLFILGIAGILLSRKNIILIIMSLELLLLSCNYNYILYSLYLDDLMGQVFSLLILSVGASESAIGLALVISYYRTYKYI